MSKSVSVIGLGKLGLCFAACAAKRGFSVIGVDTEKSVVTSVNRGIAPWFEPGLSEIIKKHGGRLLKCTTSHEEAIKNSDLTFVLVPTPSNNDGTFSNRFITDALCSLSHALKKSKKAKHFFVISSTIIPNSIKKEFIPQITKISKRKEGRSCHICYNPDFVKIGNVLNGFLRPDYLIIGSEDKIMTKRISDFYKKFCEVTPKIFVLNIISSELAKIFLNCYITLKISYANLIGNLSQKFPGSDIDSITNAIGADKRIAPYYLKSGLAFGGTCFPRDINLFKTICRENNVTDDLIKDIENINHSQNESLFNFVKKQISRLKINKIGIFGLSFVPNSGVITESPSIKLIDSLLKLNLHICVFDLNALETTRKIFGTRIQYFDKIETIIDRTSFGVICHNDDKLKRIFEDFKFEKKYYVVDCWRILKRKTKNLILCKK